MRAKERKRRVNSFGRVVFVAISLLLQVGWYLLIVLELNNYSTEIALLSIVVAALAVLRLYSKNANSAYKMPWIMLIMAMPVMGLSFYVLVEAASGPKRTRKRITDIRKEIEEHLTQNETVLAALEAEDRGVANQCRYLWQKNRSPVYSCTGATYYGEAADAFEAMKADLEKAESFIFMEYFIVEDAQAFSEIRQILIRKAKAGVEVRLMYDDLGSIGVANLKFARQLNREGINCRVFNPAMPILNVFLNHRDHRKITVIDGKVGYTGGYNLANEYFGITHPHGHWKDTGLRLEGEGVESLTAVFLELWNVAGSEREDPSRFMDIPHRVETRGYVQPFGDDPLGPERAAENVLLNMIGSAMDHVYLMTPYLIITDELGRALTLAAKRGVDVRIITPGIPDKKTVYAVTRSYYAGLASQGIRIYEYAPGFLHAKQCVCDGKLATIGTSNLDYRSLYLHFENNVLLYDCQAVEDMEQDFLNTFPVCREMTEKYCSGRSRPLRIWQCILRLFAPLL